MLHSRLLGSRGLLALLGALVAVASAAQAQSWDGDDIRQTVVRVAFLSGEVSYNRGDDPDDWQPASLNFPMTLGDRLYTERGSRLELQTEGGAIYLAPETELAALNLTDEVKQFSLGIGSASFHLRRVGTGEVFEVDTPNAAITLDRAGDYRIDVDRDGNTRVFVNRGRAQVAAAGGEVPVEAGRLMAVDGSGSAAHNIARLPPRDSWDQWVETRSQRSRDDGSSRYVHADIPGLDDLDEYGRWSEVPEYGTCWSPASVPAGWQPYREGRWAWQDPWGWSWVSSEPWGWAPYHYGRWVTSRGRWYWVPVRTDVERVRYAPALVAFVGGPGFSGGYVGWFPLSPRDQLLPWWGSPARETFRVPSNYLNRAYVTVVNQSSFLSGTPIAKSTIRDERILREISSAPVVRGTLPVVPVASSIRVSERTGSATRPPPEALLRPVVTRRAPAAAPRRFRERVELLRESRGAPMDPAPAARVAPDSRAIRPSRPLAVGAERVLAAPKPAPVPVKRVDENARRAENARALRDADRQQELATHAREDLQEARRDRQGLDNLRQQAADGARREQATEARRQHDAYGARRAQQDLDATKDKDDKAQGKGKEKKDKDKGDDKDKDKDKDKHEPDGKKKD